MAPFGWGISDFPGFGNAGWGVISYSPNPEWLLRLSTSYFATFGEDASNSSTAQKVVEAFDVATGLVLVTVPDVSLTAPVPGLRLATTVADGSALGIESYTETAVWNGATTVVGTSVTFDGTTTFTGPNPAVPLKVGHVYVISGFIESYAGGSFRIFNVGLDVYGDSAIITSAGAFSFEMVSPTVNSNSLFIGVGFTGSFDYTSISVKQVIPTFINNDGSGSALHPLNASGEMKLIPWRLDTTAYALDDEIVTSVGVHNHYYTCTTAGTTAASAPTYTDSGVQPLDGDAVFTYAGRYSNKATSTVNHYPAVLTEKVATQQLLNSDVPTTQTTGSLATGDYVLWQNGSGSSDLTAGTATISTTGSATDGSPLTFTVPGAGTVTVTITGGPPDEFQLEGGSIPSSFIKSAGATVTRPADALTSAQLITAERLALRYTGNGTARTLLSDGTNILAWSGTAVTFTDGTTTLTYTGALAYGSTIALDFVAGTLTVGGTLRDTDAALDPTWGAITVIDSVSDIKVDSTIDLTDIIGD